MAPANYGDRLRRREVQADSVVRFTSELRSLDEMSKCVAYR